MFLQVQLVHEALAADVALLEAGQLVVVHPRDVQLQPELSVETLAAHLARARESPFLHARVRRAVRHAGMFRVPVVAEVSERGPRLLAEVTRHYVFT